MRAGLLTEIITIRRATTQQNEYGEREEVWANHYTTKARIVWKSGNLVLENGEIRHSTDFTCELWDYVDVKETDLILWNEKTYRIISMYHDKPQQKIIMQLELVND